jgi:glycosyltransferase involved in cell wall biosynthesis
MRILWVKLGGLFPPHSGGRLRSFQLLRELCRRHEVTLLTTHGEADDLSGLVAALSPCEIRSYPNSPPKFGTPRFAAALARSWLGRTPVDLLRWRVDALREDAARRLMAGHVDVCVADFLVGAFNVPTVPGVTRVLFEHNVEHRIWQRLAAAEPRAWRRKLIEIESRKVRQFEALACHAADLTIAVSEADRHALEALAPGARVHSIPTGVDVDYFHPNGSIHEPNRLVFTGSMDWYPNEDAMLHFMDRILPRIRASVPDVTLTIAGRNPSRRLRAAAERSRASVTGLVEDVRPFVDSAAVYVVPLRVGGGTRLKIVEALAMAKAVVSTRIGAEGLPLTSGEHIVLADEPVEFAEAVVSLLRTPARRDALGRAGRSLVVSRLSWHEVANELEGCLEAAKSCA